MTKTILSHISAAIAASCLAAQGQIVFTSADLPSQVGDYYRAYAVAGTNIIDVTGWAGQPGGPHRWDFSAPPATNEEVWRMDVAPPTDGGHEASFPDATYIERTTVEGTNKVSRSYYRLVPNEGRRYYGAYDPQANPFKPLTEFKPPTTDLPDPIGYGTNWSRTLDWEDRINFLFALCDVAVHFTSRSQVDAYGTVVLPGIGEVPALRVNEVNTYVITNFTLPFPPITECFRNYYWLVRGIGSAVHIVSYPESKAPSDDFTEAKTVLRVFAASRVPDAPTLRPVSALRIRTEPGRFILTWQAETNRSGSRVEGLSLLGTTNWQVLAEPSANSWSNALAPTALQQFFRVLSKP